MSRVRPDRARRLAFDVLRAVHASGAYANLELGRFLAERRLPPRDAAFATELVAGTLRGEGTYDRVLEAASGRALATLQPAVVDALRLGTHQLLSMRVPARAAVDATVDLAAATVGERARGVVNAILRRVAERPEEGWLELLARGLPSPDALALRTAHPRWIVDAYAAQLPAEELEAALAANNVPAAVGMTALPGRSSAAELEAAGAEPGRLSPYAASRRGNPADLPAVREGRARVQDEGSQLVALGLARAGAPDGPWLDLCAGPGGKAALLSGLAQEAGTRLLAVDLAPHRAVLTRSALAAVAGPAAVAVVVADGTRPAWRPAAFARVLADVPCSGLGALRRRPEVRWRRSAADVEELHPLQRALLQGALDAAAPGGAVAYVTCSPHRRETTDVVAEVLASRHDVEPLDAAGLLPEVADATDGPAVQLWTHRHGTDAMFAAYFRRT